ncbi:MAG: DUF4293 domain-containing protein [Bacteroidales bacterium]|nr:DUF4293 domain-containing protein [Bacteroidales bacterium]
MIQRIQSFLLVLVVVGAVLMFMFPMATYSIPDPESGDVVTASIDLLPKDKAVAGDTTASNIQVLMKEGPSVWPMAVLAAIIGLIALVSIFLYKNRIRQMRVVSFGFLVNIVYIGLIFLLYVDKVANLLAPVNPTGMPPMTHYSIGTWTPFVTAILLFLAQRAIRSDEIKVQSADRLR